MRPKILIAYPSGYSYPARLEQTEIKSAQLLLASYLSHHFPVTYADFESAIGRPSTETQVRRFERKVREYLEANPHEIIALSCWTSLSYRATVAVARITREVLPKSLIVVGGYHATARPDDFCSADHLFDYVVRGEGEHALREIAELYATEGLPSKTAIITGRSLYPEDFVEVNWDLAEPARKDTPGGELTTLGFFLSRGCPFECNFCMESLKDRCWRPYLPERAMAEVRRAAERYKFVALAFGDACFGVQAAWRKEFLRYLADYNPPFWIVLETRPEFLDEDDIRLLSRLKVTIQFGVESCSPRMLTIMNKSRQPERFLAAFRETSRLLSSYGIPHGANLIFNHPGDTLESVRQTFAFIDEELAARNDCLFWACTGYMHFPGNALDRDQASYEERFGTVFPRDGWWKNDGDPIEASRQVIPSRELNGDNLTAWKRMLADREELLKAVLSPQAFAIAAGTYYPHWRNDTRYESL